jgi:hypothetical protein
MQSNIRLFWLLLGVAGIWPCSLSSLALDLFDIYEAPAFSRQDVVFLAVQLSASRAIAINMPGDLWFYSRAAGDYISGYFSS